MKNLHAESRKRNKILKFQDETNGINQQFPFVRNKLQQHNILKTVNTNRTSTTIFLSKATPSSNSTLVCLPSILVPN